MNNIYYTYVYLDPTKKIDNEFGYEPFYVGKGKNKRHLVHLLDAQCGIIGDNKLKYNKIKKLLNNDIIPLIIFYAENITDMEALYHEKQLIAKYGTIMPVKNVKSGCLSNLTAGGDGTAGKIWTEEQKRNMKNVISKSEARKLGSIKSGLTQRGRKQSPESNAKRAKAMKGKKQSQESIQKGIQTKIDNGSNKHSDECKEKIRIANTGIIQSSETIKKRMETFAKNGFNFKTNAKTWIIKNTSTEEIHTVLDFASWCESHGLSCYYILTTYKSGIEHKKQPGWIVIDKYLTSIRK